MNYPRYGGAGIKVAPEWMTFKNFLADMGERPSRKHTLGRILDFGDYESSNAFWMSQQEQNLARKNHNALLKWKIVTDGTDGHPL
jgi:hypothetical protein